MLTEDVVTIGIEKRDTLVPCELDLASTAMQSFRGLDAAPPTKEVERLIGLEEGQPSQQKINRQIELVTSMVGELADPRVEFKILPFEVPQDGRSLVIRGKSLRSRKISKAIAKAEKAVLFAVSIGYPVEREIMMLTEAGKHFDAFVLDAAASASVEALAESFQSTVEEKLFEEGKTTTLRFSPGYCDWRITGQVELFSLLGMNPAGIELLSSCLMTPRKSITGVFGIVDTPDHPGQKRGEVNPCMSCSMSGKCKVSRL